MDALEEERTAPELPKDPRPFARIMLREPIEWAGVTSDAELLEDAAARVIDPARRAEVRAADEADAWTRARVASGRRDAREQLLVPMRAGDAPAESEPDALDAARGAGAATEEER